MVLCEIIISFSQVVTLASTFLITTAAIVTLIMRINKANQQKFDTKVDKTEFEKHEKAYDKDYSFITNQLDDIYKELETQDKRSQKIEVFMTRIDENLKHINNKLDKL